MTWNSGIHWEGNQQETIGKLQEESQRKLLVLANALVQQDRIWTPRPRGEYCCSVFPTPCQVGNDHA